MAERSKASNFKIVLLGEGRVGKTSMVDFQLACVRVRVRVFLVYALRILQF